MQHVTMMDKADIDQLSNSDLSDRMDQLLYLALCELYPDPRVRDAMPRQTTRQFLSTTQYP